MTGEGAETPLFPSHKFSPDGWCHQAVCLQGSRKQEAANSLKKRDFANS